MKKEKMFSVRKRAQSFSFAFSGFLVMLKTQPNARIHLVIGVAAFGISIWLGLDTARLALVVLAIVAVWAAEAFNTAVEMLVNMISAERSWAAKWAKDIAAAAVLMTAAGAFLVGLLILGPPLYNKLIIML